MDDREKSGSEAKSQAEKFRELARLSESLDDEAVFDTNLRKMREKSVEKPSDK